MTPDNARRAQTARQRAYRRLATEHPDRFAALYADERAAVGLPPPRGPARCGTRAGAHRHRRNAEHPCAACRAAELDYERSRRRTRRDDDGAL